MTPIATHPAAEIFPLMDGKPFAELVADIVMNGLREPITLHPDGRILDGRNRYRACQEAGVAPRFVAWNGTGSVVAYVVSLNLHRRHLDESQRALVAARIATLPQGARTDLGSIDLRSQPEASELLNVSVPSVKRARVVLDHGAPELVRAVEQRRVAVSTAATLASVPGAEQREIVARGERDILRAAKEIRTRKLDARREERISKIADIARGNAPLATATRRVYPVIYADPPWRYEHSETEARAVENQYPTMDLGEICALAPHVRQITTDDAVLFLWATSPKLADAIEVIAAWNFTYRTCMVWVKDQIGMGYYARQQHELLLIATKGAPPTPPPSSRPASVIVAARTQHSTKPAAFADAIVAMYPDWPRLELFARAPRQGWDVWGNQAG